MAILTTLFTAFALMSPEVEVRVADEHRLHLCEYLECTTQQKHDIAEIRHASRAATEDERAEMKALRAKIKAEKSKSAPNQAKLVELKSQMKTVRGELSVERKSRHQEIRALLTPEQRQKFDVWAAKKHKEKAAKRTGKSKQAKKARHEKRSDARQMRRRVASANKGQSMLAWTDGSGYQPRHSR